MQLIPLKYLIIPIIVASEVMGIYYFYPICKDSFFKMLLFYIGVFVAHELYRYIENYCSTLNL